MKNDNTRHLCCYPAQRRGLGESENDYKELVVSFREALQPVGGFEEFFVQKLAFLALRLSRVYKVDVRIAPLPLRCDQEEFDRGPFQS